MKKLISLMLVITMILGTITMTNVFVAHADEPLAIDSSLVFDLDFSGYSADGGINKGLKNKAPAASADPTSEFTYANGLITGAEELEGNGTPVRYVAMSTGVASGIGVKNTAFNNAPDITIETWTKTDTFDGHMFLYGSGAPWPIEVFESGGNILFKNTNKGSISTTFTTGQWNHIVMAIDRSADDTSGTMTVYINGDKINTANYTLENAFSADANAVMGISGGAQNNRTDLVYPGKFSTVKLYNAVMTEEEAKAKYEAELPNYAVAEVVPIDSKLEFDLGNISSYNPEAVVTETDKSKGLINEAVEENQSADFVEVDGMEKDFDTINDQQVWYLDADNATGDGIDVVNANINKSPDITVEAWVKDESVVGHMFLYGNSSNGWQLQVCSSGGDSPGWAVKNGISSGQASYSSPELNKWKHIVVTLDRSTASTHKEIKVYVNGALKGSDAEDNSKVYSPEDVGKTSPFRISGGSHDSSTSCNTKFADVKLYSGVMTAEEAMDHYLRDRDIYTQKKKVFSLDVSGYNSGLTDDPAKGIKNTAGNTSTITAMGTPKVVTDEINGEEVKYLQPVSPEKAYNGAVKVVDDEIMGNPGITIESWMIWDPNRDTDGTATAGCNGHLAMLTNGSVHSIQLHDISLNTFRGSVFATATPTIPMSADSYSDKWIHYVATREYDEENNIWKGNVYINGVPLGSEITQAVADPSKPFKDHKASNYYLVIGAYNGAGNAFNGDIGTFNVYNYALSQEEAEEKYDAEKGKWEQEVTEPEGPEEPEAPWYDDSLNPEPKLVFDLNIGDYNREAKTGLTNGATDFASTGSIAFPDAKGPILVTEENAKGETLKSLRFINDDAAATPAGGVKVLQPEAMGNREITVELWVKHTPMTNGNNFGMMMALPSPLAESGYSMQILRQNASTRNLAIKAYGTGIKGAADVPSPAKAPGESWSLYEDNYADKWTHYAITRKLEKQADESYKWTAKLYIDGEAYGSACEYTAGNPLQYESETDFFMLGQYKNYPFEGNIGDFKVYNYAKEGTDIASTYSTEKEIWKPYVAKVDQFFDLDIDKYNTTTKKIENSIAYNNSDIAVTGTPGLVEENTTAGVRRSLRFINPGEPTEDDPETPADESKTDTAAGYFSVKDSDMVGKDALSMEAWIKFDKSLLDSASASSGHIFILNNGGTTKHSVQVLRDSNKMQIRPFGNYDDTKNKTQETEEWIHLAIVREKVEIAKDGQSDIAWNATIYVNGEVLENYTEVELEELANGFLDDETYKLDVGAYGKGGLYFPGYLGDLKMYNSVRTAAEVEDAYKASKALYQAEVVNGKICVGNTSYFDAGGYEIDNLGPQNTAVTAKYKIINYTEAAVTPGVAVLGYYENDVLQKVVLDTETTFGSIAPLATSPEYTIEIDGIEPKEGSYLRLFVWDGLENLAPVVVNKADMMLIYDEGEANE